MEPRTIFFVGKPGSGKGDQAKLLASVTGWRIFTPGAQFRAMAEEQTFLGRKVKSVIDAGGLLPHWLVEYVFLKNLLALADGESVIFDGFARRAPEAEFIAESLKWLDRPFSVVNLTVSDEEIQHRLALRKETEGRADDIVVDARLKEYREHTEPAIETFRRAGNVLDIDGERAREPIAEDIRAKLDIK